MHKRMVLSPSLLLLLLPLCPAAHADLPPPPNYVETCTIVKQCKPGEEGTTCGTFFREPDKCRKLHASDGFILKCRTRGASVWSEVYCRPKGKATKRAAEPAAPPAPGAATKPASPPAPKAAPQSPPGPSKAAPSTSK